MDQFWSIIGLSSLIASVVTVILGIARDILVEKHRFKRQSEAGYIQRQIQLYSRIYFLLIRIRKGATAVGLFGKSAEDIKELNDVIKTNSSLLESRIMNSWITIMALISKTTKMVTQKKNGEKRKEYIRKGRKETTQLILTVKSIMNDILIPKYRKIVGETVPALE